MSCGKCECGAMACDGYCSNPKCKHHILNEPDRATWFECKLHGDYYADEARCGTCTEMFGESTQELKGERN